MDCLNLQIKGDSFVVESNIHFPTDLNLLWDSLRKLLETMGAFQQYYGQLFATCHRLKWLKKARSKYRSSSEIHRKKGNNYQERLEESVNEYLEVGRSIENRGQLLLGQIAENELFKKGLSKVGKEKLSDLLFYQKMVTKHLDLVHRRIILGETIPHSEKIFSIFEEHAEWNSKGKANKAVEFGHNVLIATDQYHFILHGEVYEHQVDKQRTIALGKKLEEKYQKTEKLESLSLDRNFYSLPAEKDLSKRFKIVVLPKPGRQSKLELAKSADADYQQLKQAHSGIEGNINQLEQNGLDICRDKGIVGFKRYVAYGVLSYNLHRLGTMLILADRIGLKKRKKRKKRRRIALAA